MCHVGLYEYCPNDFVVGAAKGVDGIVRHKERGASGGDASVIIDIDDRHGDKYTLVGGSSCSSGVSGFFAAFQINLEAWHFAHLALEAPVKLDAGAGKRAGRTYGELHSWAEQSDKAVKNEANQAESYQDERDHEQTQEPFTTSMTPAANYLHDKHRDGPVPKESDTKAAKELRRRRKTRFECDRAGNYWTARAWHQGRHNTALASTDLSGGIDQ